MELILVREREEKWEKFITYRGNPQCKGEVRGLDVFKEQKEAVVEELDRWWGVGRPL